ncbi:unnamed protein product [Cuscuta campestris]|uniref:F-box domain-containing protein n=1 Tax=Cuscuta campestris TaxID=132261 RepID=A0A484LZP4_9ASTE|nr:unnamed protein product [Cuscuta campestris]
MERNVIKKSRVHSPNGSTSEEGLIEKLPVEIIGEILSRVGVARDVIRASLTRRKWREAFRKHLPTLSFDVSDGDHVYHEIPTADLEVLITKTLFQTNGVRKLSIATHSHKVSAVAVLGWLMFTRETLSELFYRVIISPTINVLDLCGMPKLKTLSLYAIKVVGVEPVFHQFPYLTSLCLNCCCISGEDLNRVLLALPKLECLELRNPEFGQVDEYFDEEITVKLRLPTLKTLLFIRVIALQLILETCDIGYLHVNDSCFGIFKVHGSKNLRHLKISKSHLSLLEIEEGENLEILEFVTSHVVQSNLFPMKVQAPKLKMFRIWRFIGERMRFYGDPTIIVDGSELVVDLDQIAVCSPQLNHLSIFYDVEEPVNYNFRGVSPLENVVILDVGWDRFKWDCVLDFTEWTEKVLKCCPNLGKLIVHGKVIEPEDPEYLMNLAEHTSSMSEMLSKYPHIEVKFTYNVETFQNTPLQYGFGADW